MPYGYGSEDPETTRIMAVLDSYYQALEEGRADAVLPDPSYQWRRAMSLEMIRDMLAELDAYWWAQKNYPPLQESDAGPELSRLPDAACWALAQELDALLPPAPPEPHGHTSVAGDTRVEMP